MVERPSKSGTFCARLHENHAQHNAPDVLTETKEEDLTAKKRGLELAHMFGKRAECTQRNT